MKHSINCAKLAMIMTFAAFLIPSVMAAANGTQATGGTPLCRTFEFRAISSDAKANGETDFKGETEVMTTEGRVAFLNAYTDFASIWFGDPELNQLAVKPGEAEQRLARIKPQPLTDVRKTIRLNDGWKQVGVAAVPRKDKLEQPWRVLPGAKLTEGELILPAGNHPLLDLAKSSGWRFEIRWEIRRMPGDSPVRWSFGGLSAPESSWLNEDGWHSYRMQGDLAEKRGYLWKDDQRVGEFPLDLSVGSSSPFQIASDVPVGLRSLVFIDCRNRIGKDGKQDEVVLPGGMPRKVYRDGQPYEPVVLADDNFRTAPAVTDWNMPSYDDTQWLPTILPCAHGGFREIGEDLYLRRTVEIPTARRVWLEVEALDPSGEVYVNGKLAGKIPNRLPVLLDISPLVMAGSNLIAYKVNYNWIDDLVGHAMLDRSCGWFAGRTTLHVMPGDTAIRELLVHTTALDDRNQATQAHQLAIENTGGAPFEGWVEVSYRPWFPKEGEPVARKSVQVKVAAHATANLSVEMPLSNPSLWTPEDPALYLVSARLKDSKGRDIDDKVTTTGVRTIAQKAGKLFLNGKPTLLVGAQNMGMRPFPLLENSSRFNRCAPAEMLMSELLAIKNMGGNLIRVHVHMALNKTGGINDPRIPEMADQLGLAAQWCSPAWIREGDERSVDTANVGTYIRQLYNHPCIINWELGNHPNAFDKKDEGATTGRTDDFVRKTVTAVLAADSSRLITPTTFWGHTHYGNDLGTLDWKKRPITAVPEYTHPLVTRGSQDAITGYGASWNYLRGWPSGVSKDCLDNKIRAWFNFEHEESAAQPNWNLSGGSPWHHLRSYEKPYDLGSIGRTLELDEWRASQGWQAFSAYESMRKQIWHGVAGFSWCTIEGGSNGGTYEKPLIDPLGYSKLAWHIHKLFSTQVLAGSDNVDTVYGPADRITPCLFNIGGTRRVDLTVIVKAPNGAISDQRRFSNMKLEGGCTLTKLPPFQPKLPTDPYCAIEYTVETKQP